MAVTPEEWTLETIRKFINTNDIDKGTDQFSTIDGFSAWLLENRLAKGRSMITKDDLRLFVDLREGLRALTMMNSGMTPQEGALRRLEEISAKQNLRLVVSIDGLIHSVPEGEGVVRLASWALLEVYRSMVDRTWFRLKVCKNDACLWAFYDRSRNYSGKWCSMSECGNKMKARRFLSKTRRRETQGSLTRVRGSRGRA